MEIPKALLDQLTALKDFEKDAFIDAHQLPPPVSIRLNPFKKCEMDLPLEKMVPWNSNSYYLEQRPSFTMDPLFHAGAYYVQEAGSMFLEHALKFISDLQEHPIALDLCASPGGKSTILSSFLQNKGILIANEVVKHRATTLSQNLSKWGASNSVVINNDPADLSILEGLIDLLVIDAPCSGSGLFRKQPDAIQEWSEESVEFCSSRQKRIISDSISLLKPNGYLFYSTCSFSAEENEENVKWMMNEFDLDLVKIDTENIWGITKTDFGFRFYPHLTKSEGFFCALLQNKSDFFVKKSTKSKKNKDNSVKNTPFLRYLPENSGNVVKIGEFYHFFPEQFNSIVHIFHSKLYFKKAGICLGELKGKDLIPNHDLALSIDCKHNETIDLTKEDAIAYLRKQELKVSSDFHGFSLLRYKKLGLGWGKALDRRFNNYLPTELRILS